MAPRYKGSVPVKLGLENGGKPIAKPVPKSGGGSKVILAFVVLAILGGIIAAAVVLLSQDNGAGDDNIENTGSFDNPEGGLGGSTTAFPTTTPRPTGFPTPFPTTPEPTPPTTPKPSLSAAPTNSPTRSPVVGCGAAEDPTCGCNREVSRKMDILWFMDESGSVGSTNYFLAKTAIQNFIQKLIDDGSPYFEDHRHGFIEFNHQVREVLSFTAHDTKQALFNNMLQSFASSGTNQKGALEFALNNYLDEPENAAREGAQLILIMLTDGNPCVTGGCPASDLPGLSPIPALQALADVYDFTFIFLPLEPKNDNFAPINLELFGEAPDNGLTEEQFIALNLTTFDQLDSVLSTSVSIPLGPCVPLPTSGRRVLKTADAGKGTKAASVTEVPGLKAFET